MSSILKPRNKSRNTPKDTSTPTRRVSFAQTQDKLVQHAPDPQYNSSNSDQEQQEHIEETQKADKSKQTTPNERTRRNILKILDKGDINQMLALLLGSSKLDYDSYDLKGQDCYIITPGKGTWGKCLIDPENCSSMSYIKLPEVDTADDEDGVLELVQDTYNKVWEHILADHGQELDSWGIDIQLKLCTRKSEIEQLRQQRNRMLSGH
ncbi:uncharacterized protein FOMMEDRAFT_28327 [Fomitiporia mediterranea MF3/22]|uniref:uncharacterized protein n=1 Tax=Fomitiporia mediterranea (strain MF3/22) TaxID=694068 RepID=UPI00044098A4|nr:uncharacterized protein FOMMEDRAFT_28327 [Fomitiporia mediterranea MF3/22]EJD02595.1 hypothetical protein FOMMEDRAFT_28327 [Fomitiporia mediterranea MF3/22]